MRESNNKTLNSCPQLPQMFADFLNSLTGRHNGKLAANAYLYIPSHLKYVAALNCENIYVQKITMLKKQLKQTAM